jgi:hypothetical protein
MTIMSIGRVLTSEGLVRVAHVGGQFAYWADFLLAPLQCQVTRGRKPWRGCLGTRSCPPLRLAERSWTLGKRGRDVVVRALMLGSGGLDIGFQHCKFLVVNDVKGLASAEVGDTACDNPCGSPLTEH